MVDAERRKEFLETNDLDFVMTEVTRWVASAQIFFVSSQEWMAFRLIDTQVPVSICLIKSNVSRNMP